MTKTKDNNKNYKSKGINDLSLPQRIMIFVSDNVEPKKCGQGNITLSCDRLWNMSEKEFEDIFGTTKEKVIIDKKSLEYLQIQDMIESRKEYLYMIGANESAMGKSAMKILKEKFKTKK